MHITVLREVVFEMDYKRDKDAVVLLAHGDGGLLSRELMEKVFLRYFKSPLLEQLDDAAVLTMPSYRLAVTTDAYVVDPIFFPGGDIGKLAIYGTVNDLAVSGAHPRYITVAFILEEGLPLANLEMVCASMAEACKEAGVTMVAGDTKVVPRGAADKLFITTTGVGAVPADISPGYHRVRPGDKIIINGSLGNHGLTILSAREKLGLGGALKSDCAPLQGIAGRIWDRCPGVKIMRDLTRGGLATAAKEIAQSCAMDMYIKEKLIPIDPEVQGGTEMLGLDPLYLANEGKFITIIKDGEAASALDIMHSHPLGEKAVIIGEVEAGKGNVYLETPLGGTKILGMLAGNPLPRIC